MRLRITIEFFLVFPNPSIFHAILGGLGASLDGGVIDGVALALAGRVSAGDGG